jgi:hypothetical protein
MSNTGLLEKLEKATDRAANLAIQRGMPIPVSGKSVMIGTTMIEKNSSGTYDVLSFNRLPLYENITVFDVAVIIAQRYNQFEFGVIKKVLFLESKFSKHHTDMLHYLHCMKSAKKQNDTERLAILEDKFQTAELLAKNTRDQISVFKRVK